MSGVILCFDVTDKSSFESLTEYWLPKIQENSDENTEVVLVGNKIDMINDRQVQKEDALNLIKTDPNIVVQKPNRSNA